MAPIPRTRPCRAEFEAAVGLRARSTQKKTKVPTQRCHVALGALGAFGKCKMASGVQSLNCADPGKTS
eukprot:13365792-Alexandrium_andersonii.AAC.1